MSSFFGWLRESLLGPTESSRVNDRKEPWQPPTFDEAVEILREASRSMETYVGSGYDRRVVQSVLVVREFAAGTNVEPSPFRVSVGWNDTHQHCWINWVRSESVVEVLECSYDSDDLRDLEVRTFRPGKWLGVLAEYVVESRPIHLKMRERALSQAEARKREEREIRFRRID